MPRSLAAFVWVAFCVLGVGCQHRPVAGPERMDEITFQNGVRVKVQYPFAYDRNALETTVSVPGGWVALTQFGSLIAYDAGTYRVRRDVDDRRYQCLCAAGDSLLAATADGTIDRLDPVTLQRSEPAHVPGQPRALLSDPAGQTTIAILRQPGEGDGDSDSAVAWDVLAHRGYEIPDDPTAFYVDRSRRLWIGADHGEWGGWCRTLDLNTGRISETDRLASGVYGFAQGADGTVLAYGGMSHFDLAFANIWRADGSGKLTGVFENQRKDSRDGAPSSPDVPITQIVPLSDGQTLAIFAYDDIFLVDRAFRNWRHLASLDLRYIAGRPDAMSSFPAVNSVHEISADPPSLLCSTVLDGLIEIRGGKVIPHTLESDLNLHDFRLFGPYQDGVLGGNSNAWAAYDFVILRDGAATPFDSMLPKPPPGEKWRRVYPVLIGANQQIFFADEGHSPGEGILVRWQAGEREVLARDDAAIGPAGVFATPDGKFWEADGDSLRELVDGKWRFESTLPKGTGLDFKVVNDSAPWRLVGDGKLWNLHDGPDKAYMEEVDETGADGKALICRDGLAMGQENAGATILATDKGIYMSQRAGVPSLELGGDRKPLNTPSTGREMIPVFLAVKDPRCLCRDSLGTLWFGGAGLWCFPKGSNQICGVALFPPGSGVAITSLAARPQGGILAVTSEGALLEASATLPQPPLPAPP